MVQSKLDGLDDLAAPLEHKEQKLSEELDKLEREYKEKTAVKREQLERVRAAIAGLKGGAPTRTGRRPGSRGERGKGLTAGEVSEILVGELKAGPKELPELKEAVKEKATSMGRSLRGLHMPLAVALRDERFHVEDESCSLV